MRSNNLPCQLSYTLLGEKLIWNRLQKCDLFAKSIMADPHVQRSESGLTMASAPFPEVFKWQIRQNVEVNRRGELAASDEASPLPAPTSAAENESKSVMAILIKLFSIQILSLLLSPLGLVFFVHANSTDSGLNARSRRYLSES